MSFTVLSMTVSLVAVFIPILLMGGIVGRLFREFAITLSVSLLISMFVSLSLTPMLCSRLLKKKPPVRQRRHPLYQRIENQLNHLLSGYSRGLNWVMGHQKLVMLSLMLTVMLNIFLYSVVQKGFFPNQDTGLLMGALRADQNISFQAMAPKVQAFTKIIEADPAVDSVMSSMGSGMFGSRNSANFFVRLKDLSERSATATEVANRLRHENQPFPRGADVPDGGAGSTHRRAQRKRQLSV